MILEGFKGAGLFLFLSSGPLISRKGGAFTLIGISSFGNPCEDYKPAKAVNVDDYLYYDEATPTTAPTTTTHASTEPMYGIYTNVSNYVDWIVQNSDYTGCRRSRLKFIWH